MMHPDMNGDAKNPAGAKQPKSRIRRWILVGMLSLMLAVLSPFGRRIHSLIRLRMAGFAVVSRFPSPQWLRMRQHNRVTWLDETGIAGSRVSVYQQEAPSRPRLTSDVIRALDGLPQIGELNLVLCQVTDEHLAELASRRNVVNLRLAGNAITDRGLAFLNGLQNLKFLDVAETDVTQDGVEAFRIATPWCHIDYGRYPDAEPVGPNVIE